MGSWINSEAPIFFIFEEYMKLKSLLGEYSRNFITYPFNDEAICKQRNFYLNTRIEMFNKLNPTSPFIPIFSLQRILEERCIL